MSDLGDHCTTCGRRCPKCLDEIPNPERRALLRRVKEASRVS